MLTLLEPTNLVGLTDRPNLGSAMLLGACRRHGIDAKLIKGQTRYIRNMFIDDSEELWHLFMDLSEDGEAKPARLLKYKKLFEVRTLKKFQSELRDLYNEVILNKSARVYFDGQKLNRFITLYNLFKSLYIYHITKLKRLDLQFINRYVDEIVESSPRYLGYSIRGAMSSVSREIIRRVKLELDIPVIVGGSFTPFIKMDKIEELFEKQGFDYLVIGAGEEALPALLTSLENNKKPEGIPNVCYRANGKIKVNDIEVIANLDTLPYPDFSQFDLDLYPALTRILPFQTARGCYWRKCAFCSHHNIDFGNYKKWSIEKIVGLIQHLRETYSCSHFYIDDEAISPSRTRRLSEAVIAEGLDVNFDIRGRFDKGFNNGSLLKLMRRAGISSVAWGMESGCQRVLDLMRKGTKTENISAILRKSHQNGIANMCFIICGFPGETSEEWRETVDFLIEHRPYIQKIMHGVFNLSRFSPVAENPELWGITLNEDRSYTVAKGMDRKEIKKLHNMYMNEYHDISLEAPSDYEFIKSGYEGHVSRMIIFILISHVPPKEMWKNRILKRQYGNLYPVLIGNLEDELSPTSLVPIDLNLSYLNCFFVGPEKMPIDEIELEVFKLSDGNLNINEIIEIVKSRFEGKYPDCDIAKKCARFIQDAFKNDWGLPLDGKLNTLAPLKAKPYISGESYA